MKTLFLSICIIASLMLSAQDTNMVCPVAYYVPARETKIQFEAYGRSTFSGKTDPIMDIFVTHQPMQLPVNCKITYFSLIQKNWAEGLVGFAYAPTNWLEVGISAGIENNPAIYRFGASVWIGKGKNSFLAIGEKGDGKANYFYKVTATHEFSQAITLGVRAQRFHGLGPVFSFKPQRREPPSAPPGVVTVWRAPVPITFWIMPAYDFEFCAKRLMIGAVVKF